ncbi:hypothetical protein ElyMa_005835700 [Elysia marginata]|uniref:Uncharacterized protein n=1 Tax=Elysia marginata TaxID=1093978 RepID=A0AAV4FXQ6_9GAST|nr:hypothetical protein ElyMa_005835700 [Elysia marginata]
MQSQDSYIFPPADADQKTPKQSQLIFKKLQYSSLLAAQLQTSHQHFKTTVFRQVPILQKSGLRKVWIKCFSKTNATRVVVGNRTRNHQITSPTRKPLIHTDVYKDNKNVDKSGFAR